MGAQILNVNREQTTSKNCHIAQGTIDSEKSIIP